MASCVRNIRIKHYQNLVNGFHVPVGNVGDAFLRHSVDIGWRAGGKEPFYDMLCNRLDANCSYFSKILKAASKLHQKF